MTFRELLTQKNLTEDKLSVKLRRSIKDYDKLHALVEERKAKITSEKNERKKKSLEKEISEGETMLSEMNEKLCKAVETYDKNKDRYAAAAKHLKNNKSKASQEPAGGDNNPGEGGDSGGQGGDSGESQPPIVNNNEGADGGSAGGEPNTNDNPEHNAGDQPPVKKKSGIGWLVTTLLVLGAAAVGINYYNNKS